MSILFGYFGLGLRAMSAARLGLQVAGDNIANAGTPGYARRRAELSTGYPIRVQGGLLDDGVQVERISRMHDRFLQANLERETGVFHFSEERLRGLRDIEQSLGGLDGSGIAQAYAALADAFGQLAGQAENLPLRRNAIAAADTLARRFRDTSERLLAQRRTENETVEALVREVNGLASQLASLNREIAAEEADGTVAAPLRDERQQIVERLVELTGGSTAPTDRGGVLFSLPGSGTLVTGDAALPLRLSTDPAGMYRIAAGGDGADITDRLRGGKIGALLEVRDNAIPGQLASLDVLAQDLIGRANALTTSGFDLNGNPGQPLFTPIPSATLGAAATIAVTGTLLNDPSLLAVSASGAPGDGTLARDIANLHQSASAALGNRDPADFVGQLLADLGVEIARQDVAGSVSRDVVQSLEDRRQAVSGVSLDEEAAELIRNQRAYEAAARFLQVLNEVTEVAVSLV